MLFYAGPDQIIPLTGLLGTVFGIALVFWSKIVIFFDKAMKSDANRVACGEINEIFRRKDPSALLGTNTP